MRTAIVVLVLAALCLGACRGDGGSGDDNCTEDEWDEWCVIDERVSLEEGCVYTDIDPLNCGACGVVCKGTEPTDWDNAPYINGIGICVQSTCFRECEPGEAPVLLDVCEGETY